MPTSTSTRAALPGEINYEPLDRYTAAHAAFGFLMGAARVPLPLAAAAAVGWEIVERPLKRAHPSLFPSGTQDSLANATVDALAMVAGWYLWKWMPK